MNSDGVVEALFGPEGLRILPQRATGVMETGASVTGLRRRVRAAVSSLDPDGVVWVVIAIDTAGLSKVCRWLLLPLQMAAAADAIHASGVVVGRYGVAPGLDRPTLVYELRSPAQRYAEAFLLSRPGPRGLANGIRTAIARWAGCDPAAGAIVIVGRKR